MMRREVSLGDVPSLGFAVASLCGTLCALTVPLGSAFALWLAVAAFCIAAILLLFAGNREIAVLGVYATVCFVIFARGTSDLAREDRAALVAADFDTAIVSCRGVVVWKDEGASDARSDRLWLSDVRLSARNTTLESGRLRVRLSIPLAMGTTLNVGDVLACNARIESAHRIQERSIRELSWTLRERVWAEARYADDKSLVVVVGAPNTRGMIHEARTHIRDVFARRLLPDARAVSAALLIGSRSAFSSEFREDLQLTGLAHLFALSGLNTGLLVSLLWMVLAWFRAPQRVRYMALLVLLVAYAAIGLAVPSLVRSAVMAGLMIIARLISRPSHPLNLLLFAAGFELLVWPLHVLDAGFHLSYLSMAGILAAYAALKQPLQDLLRSGSDSLRRRVADTLSSTIGAQLATAPMAAMLFGRVPGLAILANVIAIPLFSLLVVLVICLLLLDPIWSGGASVVARAIEGLVAGFALLTSGSARLVGASFHSETSWWVTAIAMLLQISAIVFAVRGRLRAATLFVLLAVNLLIWPGKMSSDATGRVVALVEEHGAVVFANVEQMSCLIGCGHHWSSERTADAVESLLRRSESKRLSTLVVPSHKASQIGGAPELIETLQPDLIVDLGVSRDTRSSELFHAAVALSGATLSKGNAGESWRAGNTTLRVLENQQPMNEGRRRISMVGDEATLWVDFVDDTTLLTLQSSSQSSTGIVRIPDSSGESMRQSWILKDGRWQRESLRTEVIIDLLGLPREKTS